MSDEYEMYTATSQARIPLFTCNVYVAYMLRWLYKLTIAQPNIQLVFRGRGSRKLHGNQSDMPLKHAKRIAVYIVQTKRYKRRRYVNKVMQAL